MPILKLLKIIIGSRVRYKDNGSNRFFSQNQVNQFKRLGHSVEIVHEKTVTTSKKKKTTKTTFKK